MKSLLSLLVLVFSIVPLSANAQLACGLISSTLVEGDRGSQVTSLHAILEGEGISLATSEKSNGVFGTTTTSAVISFQEKYASQVLSPIGLTQGTGIVGARTRTLLNQIGCPSGSVAPVETATVFSVTSPRTGDQLMLNTNATIRWSIPFATVNNSALINPLFSLFLVPCESATLCSGDSLGVARFITRADRNITSINWKVGTVDNTLSGASGQPSVGPYRIRVCFGGDTTCALSGVFSLVPFAETPKPTVPTSSSDARIDALLKQIAALQAQIKALQSKPVAQPQTPKPTVTLRDLSNPTTKALSVASGTILSLYWEAKNATTCTAGLGWSGPRDAAAGVEQSLPITAPTAYMITCKNAAGDSASDTLTVAVKGVVVPKPTVTLRDLRSTATALTINQGEDLNLYWKVANALTCTAVSNNPLWVGAKDPNAVTQTIPGVVTSGIYQLTCKNAASEEATATLFVTVKLPPVLPAPTPTVSLDAIQKTIQSGGEITLTWTVANADKCVAGGGWVGDINPQGVSQKIPNVTKSDVYRLTCTNVKGGTKFDEVTVVVTATPPPPPAPKPTVTLTITPVSQKAGEKATLSWNIANATSCVAGNGVTGDGWAGTNIDPQSFSVVSKEITAIRTAGYRLTCTNDLGGSAYSEKTLTVTEPPVLAPVIQSFQALDTSLTTGDPLVLSWNATNATSCTASGSWSGTKAVQGTQTISNAQAGFYNLTCVNAEGVSSTQRQIAVTVTSVCPPGTTGTPPNCVSSVSKPTVSLTITPSSAAIGQTVNVSWQTTNNPTSCQASGAWSGSKTPTLAGTQVVTVTQGMGTIFQLTCTNAGGSGVGQGALTITQAPVPTGTVTLQFNGQTVSPIEVESGVTGTLAWAANITGATSPSCLVTANPNAFTQTPAQTLNGSVSAKVTQNTAFTATCSATVNGTLTPVAFATFQVNVKTTPPPVPAGISIGFLKPNPYETVDFTAQAGSTKTSGTITSGGGGTWEINKAYTVFSVCFITIGQYAHDEPAAGAEVCFGANKLPFNQEVEVYKHLDPHNRRDGRGLNQNWLTVNVNPNGVLQSIRYRGQDFSEGVGMVQMEVKGIGY